MKITEYRPRDLFLELIQSALIWIEPSRSKDKILKQSANVDMIYIW